MFRRCIIALSLGWIQAGLFATPAFANPAVLDVTAEVRKGDPEISVQVLSSLDFGRVAKPGDGTVTCHYQISPDGTKTLLPGNFPIAEECRQSFNDNEAKAGSIEITCAPEEMVQVSIAAPDDTIPRANLFDFAVYEARFRDGDTVRANGLDFARSCPNSGTAFIDIGGWLILDQVTIPYSGSLGDIVIDMRYQ
jgi:hypothetical protein